MPRPGGFPLQGMMAQQQHGVLDSQQQDEQQQEVPLRLPTPPTPPPDLCLAGTAPMGPEDILKRRNKPKRKRRRKADVDLDLMQTGSEGCVSESRFFPGAFWVKLAVRGRGILFLLKQLYTMTLSCFAHGF